MVALPFQPPLVPLVRAVQPAWGRAERIAPRLSRRLSRRLSHRQSPARLLQLRGQLAGTPRVLLQWQLVV